MSDTLPKAQQGSGSRRLAHRSSVTRLILLAIALFAGPGFSARAFAQGNPAPPPYRDVSLSPEARAADLVSRMTLEEKVPQLMNDAPAINRLGVREYNWWNEGLHGVAAAGIATVFPQAIGMAATWNAPLVREVGDVVSIEFRAKHLRRTSPLRRLRLVRRADGLVAQHQHLSRSALGPRTGNLWRGSVPDRAPRRGLCHRAAGRRPGLPPHSIHAQALCRP